MNTSYSALQRFSNLHVIIYKNKEKEVDKRFWGILIVIVLVLGGIFIATNHNNGGGSGNTKPTSHIEGQGKAGIKLVEYGDFECPFCAQYYPVVKQVASIYNQDIYVQFRNLPLTEIHPNAYVGARAAEAAGMQNKYWQMHDLLYEENLKYVQAQLQGQTYNTWVNSNNPQSYFDQYAKQLGLNLTKFDQDFSSNQVNNSIQADISQFPKDYKAATGSYSASDEATPTFFLNGKKIDPGVFGANQLINNQATLANFENYINAVIKKKGFTPPSSATSSSSPTTSGSSSTTGQSKQ